MAMKEKPSSCHNCPAFHSGHSFVPGRGTRGARIALVGQGPGRMEAHSGYPFVGPSGRRLDAWLRKANLRREDLWITNAVQCWQTGPDEKDRTPYAKEIEFCRRAHWGRELAALPKLEVIVPVGTPAAKAVIGSHYRSSGAGSANVIDLEVLCDIEGNRTKDASELQQRPPEVRPLLARAACTRRASGRTGGLAGVPNSVENPQQTTPQPARSAPPVQPAHLPPTRLDARGNGRVVGAAQSPPARAAWAVPILHPAAILRGLFHEEPFQVFYLAKARKLVGVEPFEVDVSKGPPGSTCAPTVDHIEAFCVAPTAFAVDIEAAGHILTVIGLTRLDTFESIAIPFRTGNGGERWPWSLTELKRIVRALWDLFTTKPVGAHNGQAFDIFMLEYAGFRIQHYAFDTILMAHAADPEARKSLEKLSIAFLNVPAWKTLVKEEALEEK